VQLGTRMQARKQELMSQFETDLPPPKMRTMTAITVQVGAK